MVIPILSRGLKDPDSGRRQVFCPISHSSIMLIFYFLNIIVSVMFTDLQGVCIGLSEVMASAGRSQLLSFMDLLIPTIRTALCDRYMFVFVVSIFLINSILYDFD